MASDYVGYNILKYLCEMNEKIDVLVYAQCDPGGYNNDILSFLKKNSDETEVYSYDELNNDSILNTVMDKHIDYGITAWWPYIIPEAFIRLTKRGFINTHPAFLPYNRGKHPYFWSLVDGTPFGVTLHYVDKNIDHGRIIARKEIPVTWFDTGETLYKRSREEILKLFYENFDSIKNGTEDLYPDNNENGTFHLGKELEPFCEIDLDKQYTARTLINIMRGRMFNNKGEASFTEDGKKYYLSVSIREKK